MLEANPYNVFDFTVSRARDGPARFLGNFHQVLQADAYGGYDGGVEALVNQYGDLTAFLRKSGPMEAVGLGCDTRRGVLYLTCAYMAFRRGALYGVRWADVDLGACPRIQLPAAREKNRVSQTISAALRAGRSAQAVQAG